MTPMDSTDWPAGIRNGLWSDWAADRIAHLCARERYSGLYAADFVNGIPGGLINSYSFNPAITQAFADSLGIVIPGNSISEKSSYINTHLASQWAEYWADGWGHFYGAIGNGSRP